MSVEKLNTALESVDWNSNVEVFLKDKNSTEKVATANMRLAVWAKQLENADMGNPALSFVREMQISGQHAAVLLSLALYKPAASRIRSVFECAMYYTYFRTHLSELETLVRNTDYFVNKEELLEYHKRHSVRFSDMQHKVGLITQINKWYSQSSAVVHGQIPGAWVDHSKVSDIKHVASTQEAALALFEESVDLVNRLFLSTTGQLLWDVFSSTAKKQILHGISGDHKKIFGLDSA